MKKQMPLITPAEENKQQSLAIVKKTRELSQLLCDEENQPHQYVSLQETCEIQIYNLIKNSLALFANLLIEQFSDNRTEIEKLHDKMIKDFDVDYANEVWKEAMFLTKEEPYLPTRIIKQ